MAFALRHYAWVGLMAFAVYGAGALALGRLRFGSFAERMALACAMGLGVISYAVFAVALAGRLHPFSLWAMVLFSAALGIWDLARRARGRVRPWLVGAAALSIFALPLLVLPLYPPLDWDAIAFHLPAAQAFAASGRLIVTWNLHYAVFPGSQEMLFALALGLFDGVTAQLVQFLAFGLVAVALWAWGMRRGSATVGALAACLWLGSPTAIELGTIGYVDMGLTLFVTGAALCWRNWLADRDRGALVASAVFAGLAATAKYSGLFAWIAFAAGTLVLASPGRRPRSCLAYLGIGLATALPWYARNAIYTGDPLFPFLGSVFGHTWWSPEDVRAQMADLARHGIGRSLASFVAVWWDLAFNQGLFTDPEDLSSLAWLVPLPLLVALAARDRETRALGAIGLVGACGWFFVSQSLRYLVPILPIVCLLAAELLARALTWLRARSPLARRPAARIALATAMAALLLLPGANYAIRKAAALGPLPVTPQERDRFLEARLPFYAAVATLNRERGPEPTLYSFHEPRAAFYLRGRMLGDFLGPARYARIAAVLGDGERLYRELRSLGATHLLLASSRGPVRLPDDDFARRHFRCLYRSCAARLYELRDGSLAGGESAPDGRALP